MSQDDYSPASWSVDVLVESSTNFRHVPRISATNPYETVLAKIREHEQSGVPLIVEDWDKRPDWDFKTFSIEGFLEKPESLVSVRNFQTSTDVELRLDELTGHYQKILEENRLEENHLYGKDLPCPKSWEQWMRTVLPGHCHPLGSNDMLSHLSIKEQPETLMCYIGIGQTFTPAHKDPCGSFGHNIMCYASENGSAFWFMSETGELDEDKPSQYFRQQLQTDLDLESHKLSIQEFRDASFTVYCAKQRLGDLVLVPPRSCHQVVNAGGITVKMSWSRMHLKSLEYSLYSELLLYHRICRPEIYRVKLTVLRVIQAYTDQLNKRTFDDDNLPAVMLDMLNFFDEILVEEWSPDHQSLPIAKNDDPDATFMWSCDFCGADIFQSLFVCIGCSRPDTEAKYIVCPSCYVEGRSCHCGSENMKPYQIQRFNELTRIRNEAADALHRHVTDRAISLKWTPGIKGSSHLPTFKAACLYYDRITHPPPSKRILYCSLQSHTCSHPCEAYLMIRCLPCHRGLCFRHTLEYRTIHSVEALLVQELGQEEWHKRHAFKSDVSPPLTSIQRYHGKHSKRLASAALTSPQCRPIKHSNPGFYDVYTLVETHTNALHQQPMLEHDDSAVSFPIRSFRDKLSGHAMSLITKDIMEVNIPINDSSSSSSYDSDNDSSFEPSVPRKRRLTRKRRLASSNAPEISFSSLNPLPSCASLRPDPRKAVYVDLWHINDLRTGVQFIPKNISYHIPQRRLGSDTSYTTASSADARLFKQSTVIPLPPLSNVSSKLNKFYGSKRAYLTLQSKDAADVSPRVGPPPKNAKLRTTTVTTSWRTFEPSSRTVVYPERFGVPKTPKPSRKVNPNQTPSVNKSSLPSNVQHTPNTLAIPPTTPNTPPTAPPICPSPEQDRMARNKPFPSSTVQHTPNALAIPPTTPNTQPILPPICPSPEQDRMARNKPFPSSTVQHTPNVQSVAPPICISPEKDRMARMTETEYQGILQVLYQGDTSFQREQIKAYKAAEAPELFLCRQFKKYVEDTQHLRQDFDKLHAQWTATKLQMTYAKDVPSVSEHKKLQEECQHLKEKLSAMENDNRDKQNIIEFQSRINNVQTEASITHSPIAFHHQPLAGRPPSLSFYDSSVSNLEYGYPPPGFHSFWNNESRDTEKDLVRSSHQINPDWPVDDLERDTVRSINDGVDDQVMEQPHQSSEDTRWNHNSGTQASGDVSGLPFRQERLRDNADISRRRREDYNEEPNVHHSTSERGRGYHNNHKYRNDRYNSNHHNTSSRGRFPPYPSGHNRHFDNRTQNPRATYNDSRNDNRRYDSHNREPHHRNFSWDDSSWRSSQGQRHPSQHGRHSGNNFRDNSRRPYP